MHYAAANDTELFNHVRDLYVKVGDNHLQVFFVISWLLHHQLDLLKDKIYRAQGRIQDLEMEQNDTRVRVARLESHKNETDERMRALTGLVYKVSRSYLELSWLFLTIGFQLQASCHLQGDGSVDRPYELLEDAWSGQSRAPSPPSSGSEVGPIHSGQNSPSPVTTSQRASRRAVRSSQKRGATLFHISPNAAPGWGNTLVPVENTEPIPVPEPMLPIPGPTYASPTPRSTPSSPPYMPRDLPANPDEAYIVWLRGVMPSEREEAAIVEYARRLESGEEVQ